MCPTRSPIRRFAIPLICLLTMAGTPLPGAAQAQQRFDTELALDVRSPRIVAVTDDGARAAVTLRTRRGRLDTDHERFGDPTYVAPSLVTAMVVDTRSGERVWLHEEPAQVSDFTWSPEGDRLAYLLYDGDAFRLRIYDAEEGRARTLPLDSGKPIASSSPVVWAPDGETLLLGLRPDGWESRAREAFHAMTEAPVIVQDSRNDFLAWDRVRDLEDEQVTVLVSVADGSVRELPTDAVPRDPGFTEDGARITYTTAVPTETSYTRRDGTEYGVTALDLESGERRELVEPTEDRIDVRWTRARDAFAYTEDGAVLVRGIDADEPRDVTEGLRTLPGDTVETDFSVERWSPDGEHLLLTSEEGWHQVPADGGPLATVFELEENEDERPRRSVERWTRDGEHLLFTYSARDRWQRGIKRLDLASGAVDEIILDDAVYGQWNVSEDGGTLVYARSDGDRPDEVWTKAVTADPVQLTELNPQLDDVPLARTELVEYLDVDGNTLHGILYYPVDYDPDRTYPLVVEVYEDFFDNGFHENMNLVTAQGWFGLRPSVQFEEGYPGEAWLKAVPNAVNGLIERGLVDAEKVGVYGQSYGGYAVNLLITQTDRFTAAANVSGKVNIISFLGDSPKITTRNYAAAEVGQDRIGATLWEQPHKYIEHSAVMFADRIDTPLLMLTGEGDWNVPATNQREMYYALRRLGKDVVWVHYTAGGHGAGRASTEEGFHDHWRRLLDWFAEHFEEAGTEATDESAP
ncbi:MAG: prolyl oligopeptidase family serine peptidase [Gemmatimonadota bacterium]|nr:prolyl oligopeptidase family serine peptidase [Gemmatimonadota bacterium]